MQKDENLFIVRKRKIVKNDIKVMKKHEKSIRNYWKNQGKKKINW